MINKKASRNVKILALASLLIGSNAAGTTEAIVGRYMQFSTVYTIATCLLWQYIGIEKQTKWPAIESWKFPASFLPLPLLAIVMPYYRTGR